MIPTVNRTALPAWIPLGITALVLTVIACGEPTISEGLAPPDPTEVVDVQVLPKVDTTTVSQPVQLHAQAYNSEGDTVPDGVEWSSTGGSVTSTGLFVASSSGTYRVWGKGKGHRLVADTSTIVVSPAPVTLTQVILSPSSANLSTGATRQFSVSGKMSDNSTTNPAVTYSATGGSITAGGLYTAGNGAGTFRVIATAQGSNLADTAAVTITAPVVTLSSLSLTPSSASLSTGGTQQFTVSGTWSDGSTTTPAVTYSATGGTVTAGGLYTAGGSAGSYRVIAVQQGGTKADTAAITVTAPAVTLISLVLTPSSTSVTTGGTRQFSVSGTWSDGSTTTPAVNYSATGGSISATGLYTAGSTAGSYVVIAAQQGGTKADTSTVTVTAPVVTLTGLALSPPSASISTGGTRQFSVSGTWSDGSTTTPAVNYTATGGTITTGGLYTAGSTAGTFRIIATQQGGTMADTSSVTVTSPVATLTTLTLAPATASIATGGTRQFSVTGTWSDGSTTTPTVTYSATGGTITTAGLYTAGVTTGTFRVIATQQGGTLADTSTVTITTPVLTQVILTPSSVGLAPGSTAQFAVSGVLSGGGTSTPAVTYAATGGTITTGGLYTAGSTAGTFRVIAVVTGGTLADTASVNITATDPGEPVYTAGVDGLVYQDGFDNYTYPVNDNAANGQNHATFPTTAYMKASGVMPSSMGGGPYSADPNVYPSASLDVGRNGTGHSIRSNNTMGTEGGNPQSWGIDWMGPMGSGVALPTQFAKHVFQYWFRINAGGGPGNQGNKWFEWWASGSAVPANDIRMQVGPYPGAYNPGAGQNPFTVNDQLANIINTHGGSAAQPVGPYFTSVNDGQWHRFTIAWLSPTGQATRDGYVRVWLDGTKILDLEQATVGVKPAGGTKAWCTQAEVDAMPSFRVGSFKAFPSHVNSATANWSMWTDDFTWWTEP